MSLLKKYNTKKQEKIISKNNPMNQSNDNLHWILAPLEVLNFYDNVFLRLRYLTEMQRHLDQISKLTEIPNLEV